MWKTKRARSRYVLRVANHSMAWAVFGADAALSAVSTEELGVIPSVRFSACPEGTSESPSAKASVASIALAIRSASTALLLVADLDAAREVAEGAGVLGPVLSGVECHVHQLARRVEDSDRLVTEHCRLGLPVEDAPDDGGGGFGPEQGAVQVDRRPTGRANVGPGVVRTVAGDDVQQQWLEPEVRELGLRTWPVLRRDEYVDVCRDVVVALGKQPASQQRALEDDVADALGAERTLDLLGGGLNHEVCSDRATFVTHVSHLRARGFRGQTSSEDTQSAAERQIRPLAGG